ncbi:MAG: CtsR family transcriptional regulator [Clostridia bacterium]|nr:CtsR family transcriptional regulator [Clostridia bacterium]MDY5558412.1 CtsR family transcriptional regulator [Candidatus Heritagella sp.]
MQITDRITRYLEEQMQRENGYVQFQRNALASLLGCAPSQITYVVASHYTAERGYRVESRRGGGGFIRITRVGIPRPSYGDNPISVAGAQLLLQEYGKRELVSRQMASAMEAAVSDQALSLVPWEIRDKVRDQILRCMLLAVTEREI